MSEAQRRFLNRISSGGWFTSGGQNRVAGYCCERGWARWRSGVVVMEYQITDAGYSALSN